MTLSLYMDIALAVLLVIAIAYCWRLEGRLKALRSGKDGMLAATRELATTIAQAETAVTNLRHSADESGKQLQARIDEAQSTLTPRQTPGRQEPRYESRQSSVSDLLGDEPARDAGLRRRMNY